MPAFYPLGYPVEIYAGEPAIYEAAAESWGSWKQLFDEPPLHVRVEVRDAGVCCGPPRLRAGASQLEFTADESNRAHFSSSVRSGRLLIARGALERRSWFRYHFLDAFVLTALDMVAFTPVHAACVARAGRGLLLCGDSGAGKSSLAYHCACSGWDFVSDDAVHIARGRNGMIVGDPQKLHLRASAASLFPEIAHLTPALQQNGKTAIEARAPRTSECAIAAGCVFLSRRTSGPAELRPYDAAPARGYFRKYLSWGNRRLQEADFDAILRDGCWELRYSGLDDAARVLETLAL